MKTKTNKQKAPTPVGSGDWLGCGIDMVISTYLPPNEPVSFGLAPVYFWDFGVAKPNKPSVPFHLATKHSASKSQMKNSNRHPGSSSPKRSRGQKLDVCHSYKQPNVES
jgi:hypothetical protein